MMPRNSDVDQAVADLQKGEAVWASLTLADRRALLAELVAATAAQAKTWVEIALKIKGLAPDSPLAGEEWISGPYPVLTGASALMASLEALEKGGSPVDGFKIASAPGGRSSVHVVPHNAFDWLLLNGFKVEVWTHPGAHPNDIRRSAGLAQRTPEITGGVGVVLGAGNIFSIAPLDTLYELFAHNRVVALKLNPITDGLLPVLEEVFAPFIGLGLVRILRGGADIGTELAQHPAVAHVHMTGSNVTHDAIVFGPGEAGAARKAANDPQLSKPMTSELGGVSPTIVLPGKWSARDLRFQAEHIVTQKLHNNGYNCIASQVVVLSADWPLKQQFLTELRAAYHAAPTRTPYYPGSDLRVVRALEFYPASDRIGQDVGRHLVTGLSPDRDEDAFRTEYFSPVLGITELPGTGPEFLDAAVDLANNRLAGTLGVNVVGHPRSLRALGPHLENAIADLRYGTVAVNAWTGVGFLSARASWGAFPGHTVDDVQSGIGVVHNALLINDPERTVVRGPFRPLPRSLATGMPTMSPRPPWFVTNRAAAVTGRRLTYFAANPRWRSLPAIFASALRG